MNKLIEEDNSKVFESKAVDDDINEISDEIAEIDDSEYLCVYEDESTFDEAELIREEGGIISYLDETEDQNSEERGFRIFIGIV